MLTSPSGNWERCLCRWLHCLGRTRWPIACRQFVFGTLQNNVVHLNEPTRAAGYLEYEKARVRWFLSIDENDVPAAAKDKGARTYRSITANGEEIEFSGGFTDLHTVSYQHILAGNGFGLEENRVAIETVAHIRDAPLAPLTGDYHPFLSK